MAILSTARAMPSGTKIKRGLGLMLVAAIGWALLAGFYAVTRGSEFGVSPGGAVLELVAGLAVVGCLLWGVVLLLWGLLRG